MNVDELTQNDKNMDFKPLNLRAEVQDEVMAFWKFSHPAQMFEAGVLLLQTFTAAANQGATMLYFSKQDETGKKFYYEFDFLKMIDIIKDSTRKDGDTHSVGIIGKKDKDGNITPV